MSEQKEMRLDEIVAKVKKEHKIKKIAIPFVYVGLGLWDGICGPFSSGASGGYTAIMFSMGALGYGRLFGEFDTKGRYDADAVKREVRLSWRKDEQEIIPFEHAMGAVDRKIKRGLCGVAIISAAYGLGYGLGRLLR